jgi:hypothetical protein
MKTFRAARSMATSAALLRGRPGPIAVLVASPIAMFAEAFILNADL